ncbi:hypothetical protein RJT34_04915 [Clitoria ternatea]|uniref:Uncharacterized protein n=1 Tax=Clitoria ternatea TaxID=43366 RepID=A0AAN9Q0Y5_CLITE
MTIARYYAVTFSLQLDLLVFNSTWQEENNVLRASPPVYEYLMSCSLVGDAVPRFRLRWRVPCDLKSKIGSCCL